MTKPMKGSRTERATKARATRGAGALAAADGGTNGARRSHERVSEHLDPLAIHLEVLRLQLHALTARDESETQVMAEAAGYCDEARRNLDDLRALVGRAGTTAGLETKG